MTKKEIKFEEALEKLEEIVDKLESGDVDLSEALGLFEKGVELTEFCNKKLDEAKKKIEILVKQDGKFTKEPFVTEETDEIRDESEEKS